MSLCFTFAKGHAARGKRMAAALTTHWHFWNIHCVLSSEGSTRSQSSHAAYEAGVVTHQPYLQTKLPRPRRDQASSTVLPRVGCCGLSKQDDSADSAELAQAVVSYQQHQPLFPHSIQPQETKWPILPWYIEVRDTDSVSPCSPAV